jgi:hypothetical protein
MLFAPNIVNMHAKAISLSDQHLPAKLTYMAMAAGSVMLAFWLAWHYPLGGVAAWVAVLGVGAVMFWQPWLWLVAVPALLPLIGWAPWSGWVTFEELDLLALTSAAAGYARLAYMPIRSVAPVPIALGTRKSAALGWFLVGLFAASTVWAMGRGFDDAGGFAFGWFQGYMEPMNSVRVGKVLFLALLLWPLWRAASQDCDVGCHAGQRSGSHAVHAWFSAGMAAGLAGVALTTMWERTAFVGLMNFATDYRTTGMFWEMHVGGAALDGYLALTVPFAVQQLMVARKPAHWVGAGLALGLGLYACLTTFSRGVYLALPVGLMVMLWLHYRQQGARGESSSRGGTSQRSMLAGILVVVCFAVAAAWVFPTSGYRGAFAVMGAVVALLALAHWVRRMRLAAWVGGAMLGVVLSVAMVGAFAVAPKSSYVSFALAFLGCMGVVVWAHRQASANVDPQGRRSSRAAALAVGCFAGAVTSAGLVFLHWGEAPALSAGLPVLGLLLLALVGVGLARRPLWPNTLHWQAVVAGCMLMALTVVGVFSGGDYISNRFSTGRDDMGGRVVHWLQGLGMLGDGADLNFGKGMGRYPATYYMIGPHEERVGDFRLVADEKGSHLAESGGFNSLRGGSLFRVSQRVGLPVGKVMLNFDVKATQDVGLAFEVCPKHLLYTDYGCLTHDLTVKGKPGEWQHFESQMPGGVSRGDWYAPKLLVFSVAVTTKGGVVALDNLRLHDEGGSDLLANGDFSQGLAHWFSSSDRNHLPWHIKSMLMNVVFDQGLLGLALFVCLITVALWRLTWGAARSHALAPAIVGAIVGFGVVGLFDSLLDVPRVAFLFYFLVLLALGSVGPTNPELRRLT